MKTNLKFIALGLLFISLASFNTHSKIEKINALSQNNEPNRLLPEKLQGIDYGIQGSHFPNPTYAMLEDGMYVWKHDTSVKATAEDLQIVEYGSYVYTDKGWYLRVTYDSKMFAETYKCKGGLLKKGKTYTDPTSWRKSDKLFGGDAMWFYIAKNKAGKLFKGTALIETEARLITENKTLNFDTKKSSVAWTGYGEVGNYSLTGTVNLKSGNMTITDDKIVSGTIVIDLKSIKHSQSSLVDHLKSNDFFDVTKYPTAKLKITKSKILTDNSVEITGNLTIKKTTKAITITMKREGDNFSGKITLDRTAFGVQYGSKNFFDNLGDQAIKNDFDLEFKLVGVKNPDSANL